MALDQPSRNWYGVPQGYDYFFSSGSNSGGAVGNNLQSAPDGTVFDFGTSADQAGFSSNTAMFMKRGRSLVPFYGDPSQYGGAQKVYSPYGTGVYALANQALGIAPEQYAIGKGQTPDQSAAAYNADLSKGGTVSATGFQQSGTTTQSNPIQDAYKRRDDLKALYNEDGTAKDPNNPKVKGIPTLQDWAQKYGQAEDPAIKQYLTTGGTSAQTPGTTAPPTSTTGASGTSSTSSTQPTQTVDQILNTLGITPEQQAQMPDNIKAAIAMTYEKALSMSNSGNAAVSWNQALQEAQSDPTLMGKYADMSKMDLTQFQQSISQLQAATTQEMSDYQRQFEQERKDIAEQHAAAGTAYSGFRQQAKEKLAAGQSSIITSSKAALAKNIQDLGSSFEAKYGTSALPGTAVSYIDPLTGSPVSTGYTAAGGVTGSVAPQKQADILTKAQQNFQTAYTPPQ